MTNDKLSFDFTKQLSSQNQFKNLSKEYQSMKKKKIIKKRPKPMLIKFLRDKLESNRKVLYRNFQEISQWYSRSEQSPQKQQFKKYLVEICISKDRKYINIILFPDYDDTETFLFENLTYKIFSKFLFDSNGLYFDFVSK